MQIDWKELIGRKSDQPSEDIEYDLIVKLKRHWKKYLIVTMIILSICFYSMFMFEYKLTDIDKIKQYNQQIIDLQEKILDLQVEQKQIYQKLKENAAIYNSLLSGERNLRIKIEEANKQIKYIITK